MENNLFSLGFEEQSGDLATDPAIHCALAQAKALDSRGDLLARLSLYEQRLNRTLTQAKAELKQLQQERAETQKKALEAAARIAKLKQALNQPWQPEQRGFEFSSGELILWMRRRQLVDEADDFKYHGRLPISEASRHRVGAALAVSGNSPRSAAPGSVVPRVSEETAAVAACGS